MSAAKLTRRGAARWIAQAGQVRTTSTPLDELVNSLEFGVEAERILPEDVFATIAGSDRSAFDRYTFRPRMNVPTLDMDLSVELLGHSLFTPIVVGPVADQARYHPEGERATLAGAFAADTPAVLSSDASVSMSELASIAAVAGQPLWIAVNADERGRASAEATAAAGAKAIFINVGTAHDTAIDWKIVAAIREAVNEPVVVKGVMSAAGARTISGTSRPT